jgi:hypothetical protein
MAPARSGKQTGDHPNEHQCRHHQIGGAPTRIIGDVERACAGSEQAEPIAEIRGRRHDALPLGRRGIDAPTVDDDILRGGEEGGDCGADD